MSTPTFLKHKIERAVNRLGSEFSFTRMGTDEFNQPTETEETVKLKGLYHEQNSFIALQNHDSGSVQRKKSPMVLTLMENISTLKQGDITMINGVKYRVSGILDIQNFGVAADISLEMEV